MSKVFYQNNLVDTTSTDQLSQDLLVKTVAQEIESKVFEDKWGIFTKQGIGGAGFQYEEIEVANLEPTDFDPTGAGALTKKDLQAKAIYHKINRSKTFKTTVSNKQLDEAMLSVNNLADLANAITAELSNSSAIADYEAMKTLLLDICQENKNMVICDMNGNAANPDAFIKLIQVLNTRMQLPSVAFNYLGFKKEFCNEDDLVLIIDAATRAILDVDSLAGAFHMDKKDLVKHILVIDEMPAISYTGVKADAGLTLNIGETQPCKTYKYNSEGSATVSGSAKAILCSKKALIRVPVERAGDSDHNGEGQFTNVYLHCRDILSYSPFKNAVVIVD